jgi:hypothetical protein
LVKFRVGLSETSTQFVVARLEFCCNANLLEGTSHEMFKLLALREISKRGGDAVGEAGIGSVTVPIGPPEDTDTILVPSADPARAAQFSAGA